MDGRLRSRRSSVVSANLYRDDLESRALTRLTNDAFADLQPAWSPDGQRIAFATERYSSDLSC